MPKKTLWLSAGAAALVLAVGCRDQQRTGEQAPPVAQSQQQAEQALERAQEAQEQAREQREAVADAREDVTEAQQELAEARQQAQQESQQALEAQRRAQQQAGQAQQQAQQAEERLSQRQEQMAQPGMEQQPGTMLSVNGQVVSARDDQLLLRSPAGESVRLLLDEQTQVFINGQKGEISDIPQGADVRASYQPHGEEDPTALRVDVLGRGAVGGSGAEGEQQQQQRQPEQRY
jgi:colicin import membrane protein